MRTPPDHRLEGAEGLDEAQEKAAKSAETVRSFEKAFHENARVLVEEGRVQQSDVDQRGAVIAKAADGNEHLRLDELEANQLGQAMIEGGDESILLAKSVAAALRTAEDVEQMQHAAAHEIDHGQTKVLKGELTFENETVDHALLYEGKADITGNLETGKGERAHRKGQPDKLYREGQDLMERLIDKVEGGRAKIWRVMETTGDLSELQEALKA